MTAPRQILVHDLRDRPVILNESEPEVTLITPSGHAARVQVRGSWNVRLPAPVPNDPPSGRPEPAPRGRRPTNKPNILHPRERRFRAIQELPLFVRDLTVTVPNGRDAKVLVEGISFDVAPGEMVALIGPSGAGKSTLINAINSMSRFEGSVCYGGTPLDDEHVGTVRHVLGIVPQFDLISSPLPMRQALEFTARLRMPGVPKAERQRHIEQLIDDLGLQMKLDTPLNRLSGGERKRTAVGMELLAGASIIILDEPTTGLDPDAENNLVELLGSLADYGRRTILMITHSKDALAQCDAVIGLAKTTMDSGSLVYHGPPAAAPQHFGGREWDYSFMYQRMQAIEERWPDRFSPPPPRHLSSAPILPATSWVTWSSQVASMTHRAFSTLLWHGAELNKLALQAGMSVLVMLMILRIDNLAADSTDANPVLFLAFLAISVLVMPILNATREIVRESDLVNRDLTVGMSSVAYVLSKFAYMGTLAVLQAWVTCFVLLFQGGGGDGLWQSTTTADALAVVAVGALSATAMGLAISAVGRSEASVMMWLPIVVVLQILTCGAFLDIQDFGAVANAMPAYWTFRGLATTFDLQTLDLMCAANTDCWWKEWDRTPRSFFIPISWLLAQSVAFVGLAILFVRKNHGSRR